MNIHTRISLVIPVYNEADRIGDCLQAIAEQQLRPFEVIVVDNNSADGTAVIAGNFDFVTVLHEPRQGVVYARDTGFNAARGEIIARIDADTLLASDWITTLAQLFNDESLDAVSGTVTYRDITAPKLVDGIDLFWRRRMARLLGPQVALQGANMALRRRVWQTIRNEVCHERGQHEDFDIAIHSTWHGFTVRFDERLTASVCYRQADYSLRAFSEYALISPRTYLSHGLRGGRHMYQVVIFVIALYPIISALSRGYDAELGRFSLGKLFMPALPPRVNPATYVD
jgi:glycosyltransferase involved in cell wall biosynthesis